MQRRAFLGASLSYLSSITSIPALFGCGGGGGGGNTPAPVPVSNCTAGHYSTGLAFNTPEAIALIAPANRIAAPTTGIPASWDNTANLSDYGYISGTIPPVGDQGSQGSCVAWGAGYAMASSVTGITNAQSSGKPTTQASAADLYAKLLSLEKTSCGNGTSVKDALDLLVLQGVESLAAVPYNAQICIIPSSSGAFKIPSYQTLSVTDLTSIKIAILNQKVLPIAMQVYSDFENLVGVSAKTVYSHPVSDTTCSLGGHCVAITGFDDSLNAFRIMNSWGESWGNGGFIWMDYNTFTRIVQEVYAPYIDIYQLGIYQTLLPNGLIQTPSLSSDGVTVTFGIGHVVLNPQLSPTYSLNAAFALNQPLKLSSYQIDFISQNASQSQTLISAAVSQWAYAGEFSAPFSDTTLLSHILAVGSITRLTLSGTTQMGQAVQLIANITTQGGRV